MALLWQAAVYLGVLWRLLTSSRRPSSTEGKHGPSLSMTKWTLGTELCVEFSPRA